MKRLIAMLALLAIPYATFAQDALERPVVASGTGAVQEVVFTLGSLGYLQDVVLKSFRINTGLVVIVDSTLGITNTVGLIAYNATNQSRISASWPIRRGDIVRTTFETSIVGSNNVVAAWFKNVVK